MTEQSNAIARMPQSTNTSGVALRARSTSDLTAAIRSPGDEAAVMDRARRCLALYFEPDRRAEDRVAVLEAFGKALRFKPIWAVMQAFDAWEAAETRRPSPAHIVGLTDKALMPLTRELAERQKAAEAEARETPDPERAKAICERAGFTARRFEAVRSRRMARSDAELYAEDRKRVPHWTETVDPDGPEMEALHRARDENRLIREAREAQLRKGEGAA